MLEWVLLGYRWVGTFTLASRCANCSTFCCMCYCSPTLLIDTISRMQSLTRKKVKIQLLKGRWISNETWSFLFYPKEEEHILAWISLKNQSRTNPSVRIRKAMVKGWLSIAGLGWCWLREALRMENQTSIWERCLSRLLGHLNCLGVEDEGS